MPPQALPLLLLLTLPLATTPTPLPNRHPPTPPTSPLTPIFILHALLPTLAWSLLAPLAQILSHRKPLHKQLMLTTLLLTLATYLLALTFSTGLAPTTHRVLASFLLFAAALQAAAGFFRPPCEVGSARMVWRKLHSVFGIGVMLFAVYVVHHSLHVFSISSNVCIAVDAVFVVAALAVVVVRVVRARMREDDVDAEDVETLLKDGEDVLVGDRLLQVVECETG